MSDGIRLSTIRQSEQYQRLNPEQQRSVEQEFQRVAKGDGTISQADLDALDRSDGRADRRFNSANPATNALLRAAMRSPQLSGFRLTHAEGRASRTRVSGQRVSRDYIDGATAHTSERAADGARVTVRSEVTDVQVHADGSPRAGAASGKLTIATFNRSIERAREQLRAGFEPGDRVRFADGQTITVPDDPNGLEARVLSRKLETALKKVVAQRMGTDGSAVIDSGQPGVEGDGSYAQLSFVRGPDGVFVMVEDGRQQPAPEPPPEGTLRDAEPPPPQLPPTDMSAVERKPLGYLGGRFTTAATDADGGTAHSAASSPYTKDRYYFGQLQLPDPSNPDAMLRADVKSFRPQRLGGPPEDIEVRVELENGDTINGRLADHVTLTGREAIAFLTRVGILERAEDGSYQQAIARAGDHRGTHRSEQRLFSYGAMKAIAAEEMGAALRGGDASSIVDALKQAHQGADGRYYFNDRGLSEADFEALAQRWVRGWRNEAASLDVRMSDAEVFERLEQRIKDDISDYDFDRDYSQFIDTLGTRGFLHRIGTYMADAP